jgi:hypothetical protein
LRGEAGPRQADAVCHALQHNIGLDGACVVTRYRRAVLAMSARRQPCAIA